MVLPQSATNIAAAMETAATTVVEEAEGLATDVTTCAESLATDMLAVAEKMAGIPALLDPTPILECCSDVLETAAADLQKLANDAVAIPERLLAKASEVGPVIDAASQAANSLGNSLPELVALVPDYSAQLAFFESFPARGQALADLAVQTGSVYEQFALEMAGMSTQLAAIDPLNAASSGSAIISALRTRSVKLKDDSLAQARALRSTLDGNVTDLETIIGQTGDEVNDKLGGLAAQIRKKSGELLAPLDAQIDYVDGIGEALGEEALGAALYRSAPASRHHRSGGRRGRRAGAYRPGPA